ncbi:MAG: DinB family protein [Acidobacteriota bacterium]
MTDETNDAPAADFTALLDFLNETPTKLENFTAGLFATDFCWQNSPDEFSALDNICHLRDLELQGYAPRIRRILAETDPALADFDGARVAAESNYNEQQPAVALQEFQTARQENVETFRGVAEEQLAREGTLAGVGKITLKRLAELMREHDEGHLEDVRVLTERIQRRRESNR